MDSAKIHLEINAGKCIYDGNTVKPDKRKGKLVLYKICDNLYNFQWINRENNKVEDNLILTKSISLEKVDQCKTGRVYLLRNKLRGEVSFYWMQDYDDSKDEVILKIFSINISKMFVLKMEKRVFLQVFVKKFNSIIANDLAKDMGNKRRYSASDYTSGLSDLLFSQSRNMQNADSKKGVSFKDLFVSEYISKLLEIPEAYDELKK
ncbi:26S proteasome regulatory subunit RPN13, putative [Plasmodium ovale wallikeri]|uniref:26S proteasome regulatory subunit RPN13, putative n=1 Tax=Plasmodium ovale wallikeri TaxID=864142 RepID=A0A1A8ZRM4_PLAOA|nr:26S proteasome regulatory subunit RPN13, putative [Plasmodium ovale wallikeri]SBT46543.1 26S proteasome regulatory subunit RPN13, putative [Plasmodium ovale wallikeri]